MLLILFIKIANDLTTFAITNVYNTRLADQKQKNSIIQ